MNVAALAGEFGLRSAAAVGLMALPAATLLYSYVLYPAILWPMARRRRTGTPPAPITEWPDITITLPVYNEERTLRAALDNALALDYPAERRRILVISDASTDGTDAIAREYIDRGVQLIRLRKRAGKTAAENAAAGHLHGEIVVNIDATARPGPGALKALVAAFADPSVGVASGRDVSIGTAQARLNSGESRYVGYEMWVRALETRAGSIVGASGCFYAIRAAIYEGQFPEALSRDFASALIAREHGLRAVSVEDALCEVPRSGSLDAEFNRKVRTMHRGLETLWYKRHLLNPSRHGRFAFMLFSHKLCRWLVPPSLLAGAAGLALLASTSRPGASLFLAVTMAFAASIVARYMPRLSRHLGALALLNYVLMATIAGLVAWWEVLRQQREAMWEPTRRPA